MGWELHLGWFGNCTCRVRFGYCTCMVRFGYCTWGGLGTAPVGLGLGTVPGVVWELYLGWFGYCTWTGLGCS